MHNIRLVSRSHYKEEMLEGSPKGLPLLMAVPMENANSQNGKSGQNLQNVRTSTDSGSDHPNGGVSVKSPPTEVSATSGVSGISGNSSATHISGNTGGTFGGTSIAAGSPATGVPSNVVQTPVPHHTSLSASSGSGPGSGNVLGYGPPTSHENENDNSHIVASAKALLQLKPTTTSIQAHNAIFESVPRTDKTASESGSESPLTLVGENSKRQRLDPLDSLSGPMMKGPRSSVGSGVSPESGRSGGSIGSIGSVGSVSSVNPRESMGSVSSMASMGVKAMPPLASSGFPTIPHPTSSRLDLVQLLSISKNLEKVYDSEDLQYPVDDLFLVGYSVLSNEPYSVFLDFRKDLVDSLHSYTSTSNLSDFRLGIIYTILAVGALTCPSSDYNYEEVATLFIKKAWNILVDKLIPQHTSLVFQSEILKNLYVLSYTYLRFFKNDLMLSYLEDSSHVIFQNLAAAQGAMSDEIVLANMDLFWSIYVLVSKHRIGESPPKFYSWFLAQKVFKDSPTTLQQFMGCFLKSVNHIGEPFLNEIVICTLSNEISNVTFNQSLWIYDLRNSLHNAIILINKSVLKSVLLASTYSEIFDIFKKKLILNAPPKFKDLMDYYAFQISAPYHWSLLLATLREVNPTFNFNRFMKDNLSSLFQKFGNALLEFFSSNDKLSLGNRANESNNNLGIVSFPLIFNYHLLKMNSVTPPIDVSKLSLVDLANLNNLILEWYITVVKILINLFSNNSPSEVQNVIAENTVLQCLMYMINQKDVHYGSVPPERYLLMFNELTKICDTWLNFFNKDAPLGAFRININRFLNDLFVLALNKEDFFMGDLYVTNESILIRSRRSKSISSIDMALSNSKTQSRGSISAGPPSIGQVPLPAFTTSGKPNSNYVLMNKIEVTDSPSLKTSQSSHGFMSMAPNNSLPPLQGVANLQFNAGANGSPSILVSQPIAPSPSSMVLPPIHAQATEGEKSPLGGFKRIL